MKCPACNNDLTEKSVKDIKVDICENGCGGIWFDQLELKKVDEPHEAAGENLLDVKVNSGIKVDHSKRRNCPKCEDSPVLMRHYFTPKREVEIDECPKCAGIWMDVGELSHIRKQYNSEEDRKKEANKLFEEMFGEELTDMMAKDKAKLDKARGAARALRFLCPSYYLPGKQKWGAF